MLSAHMPNRMDVERDEKSDGGSIPPREERVVTGADFHGHVGDGDRVE